MDHWFLDWSTRSSLSADPTPEETGRSNREGGDSHPTGFDGGLWIILVSPRLSVLSLIALVSRLRPFWTSLSPDLFVYSLSDLYDRRLSADSNGRCIRVSFYLIPLTRKIFYLNGSLLFFFEGTRNIFVRINYPASFHSRS